jgi:Holliday junction resolvasome RuvABC endonuclease subunit
MKRDESQRTKDREVNGSYPQFVFRTHSKANKAQLTKLVKEVLALLNKSTTGKKKKKNEVIIDALTIGLEHLKQRATTKKGV